MTRNGSIRDSGAGSELCVAYADGLSSRHPADPNLVWCVWDSRAGQHTEDSEVVATDAPTALHVVGGLPGQEDGNNRGVAGKYLLQGVRNTRAFYVKVALE